MTTHSIFRKKTLLAFNCRVATKGREDFQKFIPRGKKMRKKKRIGNTDGSRHVKNCMYFGRKKG